MQSRRSLSLVSLSACSLLGALGAACGSAATPPPIAAAPVAPPVPTVAVVHEPPPLPTPVPDPSPFAVVGFTKADNYIVPSLYRLTDGTVVMAAGGPGAWTVATIDSSGKAKVNSALFDASPEDQFETVSDVQGTNEDMWITVQRTAGRAAIETSSLHVVNGKISRSQNQLMGASEWSEGRFIAVRSNSSPWAPLQGSPQRFELLRGKGGAPRLAANVRFSDMIAYPSGKIYAVGKPAKAIDEGDPWFMWVYDGTKAPQQVQLPKNMLSPAFVRGLPEKDLAMHSMEWNSPDDATGAAVGHWDGTRLNVALTTFETTTLVGAADGTMWGSLRDDATKLVRVSFKPDGTLDTKEVKMPTGSALAKFAPGCENMQTIQNIIPVKGDDVWVAGSCGEGNQGMPHGLVLHTQNEGTPFEIANPSEVLEEHREAKKAKKPSPKPVKTAKR